jgi:hypothetical protein
MTPFGTFFGDAVACRLSAIRWHACHAGIVDVIDPRPRVTLTDSMTQGGARSELDVPKYLGASTTAYHRVIELAQTHTDAEIAEQLNTEDLRTMRSKPWTARRVMDFRVSNAIPSGLTASPTMRLPETGYLTSAEAAQRLGVDQTRIQTWFHWGVLSGKQEATQRQLWIAWNSDAGTGVRVTSGESVLRAGDPGC